MKIGIVSDTHGQHRRLATAMAEFARRGVQALVHCGDIGRSCMETLADAGVPVYAVAGNMDRDVRDLAEAAARCGVALAEEVAIVPLGDGRNLAATHGNDLRILSELIAGGRFPYVCHGHTHKQADFRSGGVRVINPGALHNGSSRTAAVLDTDADSVEFIVITD